MQRPRRIPYWERVNLDGEVDKAGDDDLIQPNNSSWAYPNVWVRKKDGIVRKCVNLRKLKLVTKTESLPLPCLVVFMDPLTCAKYFFSLDLILGYHHLQVAMEKTAFASHLGHLQYRVMPFGHKNGTATFLRLISFVVHRHLGQICLHELVFIVIFARLF